MRDLTEGPLGNGRESAERGSSGDASEITTITTATQLRPQPSKIQGQSCCDNGDDDNNSMKRPNLLESTKNRSVRRSLQKRRCKLPDLKYGEGSSSMQNESRSHLVNRQRRLLPGVPEVSSSEYEIENILYDEIFGCTTMYLVKWKNYPMDQCTWEPYGHLNNCQEILNRYNTNKIFPNNIKKSDKFKKLLEFLLIHTEQDLIELLHSTMHESIPPIEEKFLMGTIAYLTTVPSSSRSKKLMKFVKRNLLLIELCKKRGKQLENLKKWQIKINDVSEFKITVINNVDFEGPPKKFNYVNECVAGTGVIIPDDPPVWCHCDVTCGGKKRKNNDCHFDDFPLAYNKMKRIIIPRGTPIYECNKKCYCDSTCINRVVQHGPNRNLKLEIFRTDNHRGWGVKTLVTLKQGTYITIYTGEIITKMEAEKRTTNRGAKSTYMFDLDYNTEKNNSKYSVDATNFGNISHFINHSCDANLAIYAVWIDCYDTDLPTLALFASKDINVGEEITFDYMTTLNDKSRKIKCKCKSKNCRGYLC